MARKSKAAARSGSTPQPVSVLTVKGNAYAISDAVARQLINEATADITALVNAIAALSARG